jgi:DNA (cytosine-5)-methyltransferase 1
MAEIQELPWNGFNVVSTFSGCGGSCLGYRMAGFRVLWANEFIPAAQETYKANHPDSILDTRDIRTIKPSEILDAIGLRSGDIDILDGSPPCASFSTAGKREAGWGKVKKYSDKEQRTDDLFFEYVRLLRGLKPKVFVAENVSGLIKGTAKGYFIEIMKELKASNYRVSCKVLDAQWLGVPQARQRTIFVGVRDDLGIEPAHPKPLPYRYSVRDALPWIVKIEEANGLNSVGLGTHRMLDAVGSHPTIQATRQVKVEAETDISRYASGAERDDRGAFGNGGDITNIPSPTVLADSVGTHWIRQSPTEKRKFSIAELRRICAFPDDFVFTGTYAQQWERMGRAVPPVMMQKIAATIQDEILCKLTT